MVNYLDSRRIVGTTAERSSIPIPVTAGGWVELGRTTLGSAGDSISVSSLPDKRYYMLLGNHFKTGAISHALQMNGDTGTSYSNRCSINGGADFTNVNRTRLENWGAGNTNPDLSVSYISNLSSKEKLVIEHVIDQNTAGASNAPARRENVGKWANTSNAINELDVINYGAGDFTSGSELVVLGWDPDDTHTNNFWEELADVNGTNATTISSGTISAKKYLWIQLYCDAASSGAPILRFNSDSGSNYARRYSNNGGSDSTSTSEDAIYPYYQSNANPKFINMFVINNQSNEKLVISHTVEQNTAGASNSPFRNELVGKWANTSNQITNITFTDISAGNYFGTSAQLKVWGSD